jgi:hypothetical protein
MHRYESFGWILAGIFVIGSLMIGADYFLATWLFGVIL